MYLLYTKILIKNCTKVFFNYRILINCNNNVVTKQIYKNNLYNNQLQILRLYGTKKSKMAVYSETFIGKTDRYNGILVDSKIEPCDTQHFPIKLTESLKVWEKDKKRTIWFKVALEDAEWIPILTKNGFVFHHSKEKLVMLYKWLPTNEESNVPPYAHTMIGVGALIVNKNNQILVVQEKHVIATAHWKLPGGYVEPGEDFVDAVMREVLEETNVKTKFISLLTFRHAHNVQFGCSDMYIVMNLEPLTEDIAQCSRELVASKWMDLDEYLNSDSVTEMNKFFVQKYLEHKKLNIVIDVKKGTHPILKKDYVIYSVSENVTSLNNPSKF